MLNTFRALLKGNRLEWQDDAPEQIGERAVPVQVTLLSGTAAQEQGERMAAALSRLAELNAFAAEDDPASWGKAQRQERKLPVR